MDFFKVHLPSNACSDLYPNNTASDYRTHFDTCIDLNGRWEVGVESLFYSPQLDDEYQSAKINVSLATQKTSSVNNARFFQYVLAPDGSWPGFEGVEPALFNHDSHNIYFVLETLNELGKTIITSKERDFPIFQFHLNAKGQVVFFSYDKSLTIRLTGDLAKVLGYGYEVILSSSESRGVARFKREPGKRLTANDYHIKYFSSNVLQIVNRITLDPAVFRSVKSEEAFYMAFVDMWNTQVRPYVHMECFFKNNKMVIRNQGNFAIVLSPHLVQTFRQPYSFFGANSERWGLSAVDVSPPPPYALWYVDIFSTQMDAIVEKVNHNIGLTVYPWRFTTMRQVLRYLNREVTSMIKNAIGKEYSQYHRVNFDMNLSEYCSLSFDKWIDAVELSPNLAHLLGFPTKINTNTFTATREASSIKSRPRQLYLLSNMVQLTVVGKERIPILQDFLHRKSDIVGSIVERRFNPISYVPLQKTRLDYIHLQLVDENYQPVKIKDSKTLVTLYFQKIK